MKLAAQAHTEHGLCTVSSHYQQVQDLPKLLTRLRLLQAQPQIQTFKQVSDSINQLMQLRQLIATLAPAAAQTEALEDIGQQQRQVSYCRPRSCCYILAEQPGDWPRCGARILAG